MCLSRGTEAGKTFLRSSRGEEKKHEEEGNQGHGENMGKVGAIVERRESGGNSLYDTIWNIGKIPRDRRLHPIPFPPLVQCFQGNMRNIEPTSLQLAQTNWLPQYRSYLLLTVGIVLLFHRTHAILIQPFCFSFYSVNTNLSMQQKHV